MINNIKTNRIKEIKKSSLYFDIGANVGKWSLRNIKKCKKIIAVEPSRETFEVLIKNCEEKNIICLNYAVSNEKKEEIDFYECKNSTQISTINKNWLCSKESRFYGMEHTKTSCKNISLDGLIIKYGIPDLIKIDVEGAEDLAISSLTQKIETLCFEWAQEFPLITKNSIDYLIKIGFTKFYIQEGDACNFTPKEEEYTSDLKFIENELNINRTKLNKRGKLVPAWGMVWAK
jgi:FkbM family methyltransferase